MAKTKRPSKTPNPSASPPNPPPSQPPVKRPRRDEGSSSRTRSQSKRKSAETDISFMPLDDPSRKIYQIQWEHHDTLGRFFDRFWSQDNVRGYTSQFLSLKTYQENLIRHIVCAAKMVLQCLSYIPCLRGPLNGLSVFFLKRKIVRPLPDDIIIDILSRRPADFVL
ncbi:hypothetical protein LguiA_026752 [Lonicera macranthoides]